jgi:glycosyltransferase involved in cell wall biosynthesis
MAPRIALVTPASLCRHNGDSLRPLRQALGLWANGYKNFVVYTPEPNPDLPFDQIPLQVIGPARVVRPFDTTAHHIIHAHQNAGLFLSGRLWVDLHGLGTLESRMTWRRYPFSPRALLFMGFSQWATSRLASRAERIICASVSIEANLKREHPYVRRTDVIRNCVDPGEWNETTRESRAVAVIGGFRSRWGEAAFDMAARVASLASGVTFKFIGAVSDSQRRHATAIAGISLTGQVDDDEYKVALSSCSAVLLPYPSWCCGGGCRQKLMQAASASLAIVTTPAGMEGFENNPALCIGHTPAELAMRIRTILGKPDACLERGRSLRETIENSHDYRVEAKRLINLYEE